MDKFQLPQTRYLCNRLLVRLLTKQKYRFDVHTVISARLTYPHPARYVTGYII